MTNCWSEGALRAYLDRELPSPDMKLVAAHLGECSTCDALCAELSARASRVFAMLESLPELEPRVVRMRPMAAPADWRRWWPVGAVALAAGLAIASFVMPKGPEQAPIIAVAPTSPAVKQAADPAVGPQDAPLRPIPVRSLPVQPVRASSAKLTARKHNVPPSTDYFLALDDDPIESGIIMRVAVEPGNAQADIVFDPGGRARAIRLVSNKQ